MFADVCVMYTTGRRLEALLPVFLWALSGRVHYSWTRIMPRKSTPVYHGHPCMVHSYSNTLFPYLCVLRAESTKGPMYAAWAVRLAMTLLALAAGGVARADIYSFVDADGVTHFSNVPVDKRFRLLLATPGQEERAEPRHGEWLG